MFNDKDPRDIDNTNPEDYFAYTSPNTSPTTIKYILKKDLINLKEGRLPQSDDYSTGNGAAYYRDTNGRYGGSACAAHFLSAKEIQDFLFEDDDFVHRAIEEKVTWFFPDVVRDMFVF
jgi:hypothetical protein